MSPLKNPNPGGNSWLFVDEDVLNQDPIKNTTSFIS